MNYHHIPRIHMVDCKRQTLEERAHIAHRLGEFIAHAFMTAVCAVGLVWMLVRAA